MDHNKNASYFQLKILEVLANAKKYETEKTGIIIGRS